MTFLNEQKPDLDATLEHHGVKGMKWGVRRANSALKTGGTTLRVSGTAVRDYNKSQRIRNLNANNKVVKLHRETMAARRNDPRYAKTYDALEKTGKSSTVKLLKAYATYRVVNAAVYGSPSYSRSSSRGQSWVRTNPGPMNAPFKKGAFKVTTL